MTDSSDLSKWNGGNTAREPYVTRKRVVWSPTAESKPAGFIGVDRANDRRVYTTRRSDYHYYRDGEGWALSESILDTIGEVDVTHIYVHEKDSGDVWVFLTRHYQNEGEPVPEEYLLDDGDPQVYIDDSHATVVYEGYAERMFYRDFEDAMDHCLTRNQHGDY